MSRDVEGTLRLVGLARRAGRAVLGSGAVREAARSGRLKAVLFAADAAPSASDRLAGVLAAAGVPVAKCGSRDELGRAVGRPGIVVIGITEANLARRALEALDRTPPGTVRSDPGPESGPGVRKV